MIRPIIALCALLISPVWGQEPQSDLDDPEKLLARCLSEEEIYLGRTKLWEETRRVYRMLLDFQSDQCLDQVGSILAFDVEIIGKMAKGSAYIIEHCPIERLGHPQTWYLIDWDLDQSRIDGDHLDIVKKRLATWEFACGKIAGGSV